MAGLDLYSAQQSILAYVQGAIPEYMVESGGVPTSESITLVGGIVQPYIILRFSDMMPTSGGGSFMGAQWDEYYSYVDAQCLGGTDDDARALANVVNSIMLGKKFDNTSPLKKNYGGGQFAIYSEANRNPVAFVAITSYRYAVNMEDVGAGSAV